VDTNQRGDRGVEAKRIGVKEKVTLQITLIPTKSAFVLVWGCVCVVISVEFISKFWWLCGFVGWKKE